MRRRVRFAICALLSAALLVVGWLNSVDDTYIHNDLDVLAMFTGIVSVFVVTGLIAEWRRPRDPVAWLIVAVGIGVGAAGFRLLEDRRIALVGALAFFLTPLLPCHLVVAYPDGLTRRLRTWVVGACWIAPAVLAVATVLLTGPTTRQVGLTRGGRRAASWVYVDDVVGSVVWWRQGNPLHVATNDNLLILCWVLWSVLVVGVGVATAVIAIRRTRRALPVERRQAKLLAMSAVTIAVALLSLPLLAFPERVEMVNLIPHGSVLQNRTYGDFVILLPALAAAVLGGVLVWAELVQPRLRRAIDGSIPLERFGALDDLVRRSLGDPSARVLFPREDGSWVDGTGHRAANVAVSGRALTTVTRDAAPVAAVEHDVWLLQQPDLVDVTIGSVALTLESQRLAATSRAASQDIQASSRRLLRAADDARHAVQAAIETGPVRTLDGVIARFDEEPVELTEVHGGLRDALAQLREIAHELAPASIVEEGLESLLEAARRRSDYPFTISGLPAQRLPSALDVTVYLVAKEAATRATGPITAELEVRSAPGSSAEDATLRATFDGWNGSFPQHLADRIDTLAGTWRVDGGALIVELPTTGV